MTDKQLIKFTTDFRKGMLGKKSSFMMCLAISAPLASLLQLHGVNVRLVEGEFGEFNHFWLELPDGRVLDPTADQFNADGFTTDMPSVYLGKKTKIHNEVLIPRDRENEI